LSYDGKYVYYGKGNYYVNTMMTIKKGIIYAGRNEYQSNILLRWSGDIPIPVLLMAAYNVYLYYSKIKN
jgi:hypothetical protein